MSEKINCSSEDAIKFIEGSVLPDGTTANVLPEDLESGNFEEVRLELPDGRVIEIKVNEK